MKKTILSGFVVFGFIIYSITHRSNTAIYEPPTQKSNSLTAGQQKVISLVPTIGTPLNNKKPTSTKSGGFSDGTYSGDSVFAYYGYIQTQIQISNGKIINVDFLSFPNDRGQSKYINSQAMPILKQEAIQAQSSKVDVVSGATDTSLAFIQSLESAITKAK